MFVFRIAKCGWLEIAILGFACAGLFIGWSWRLGSVLVYSPGEDDRLLVSISLVQNAGKSGAVCLDGSSPAYHLHRGSGSGSKNWLVFLEGGGWCSDHDSCLQRSKTRLGSSLFMEKEAEFDGILSNSPVHNPDFFNWNRVKVRYCDGGSFASNVEANGNETVMYRGQKIWKAVILDLLSKGMNKAENALLAGCSAGGLATLLHCNSFKEFLPEATVTKCLSDGGYFLDAKAVNGQFVLRSFYKNVVDLQNVAENVPEGCVAEHGAVQCFFAEKILPYIRPPVFFVNSGYDTWQIQNVLLPGSTISEDWASCRIDPYTCSDLQLQRIEDFRKILLESLSYGKKNAGLFIYSCFAHCQTQEGLSWNQIQIGNKTMREAVGDWFFERQKNFENKVDCSYPCNPTCLRWYGWGHKHKI